MILVNLFGLALISIIVWWFWLYKPEQAEAGSDRLTITVDHGVYEPAHIHIVAGKSTELRFRRLDESPCAEVVLFPELGISESLPVNKVKTIKISPLAAGEYEFHCQMKMYRGKLIASD